VDRSSEGRFKLSHYPPAQLEALLIGCQGSVRLTPEAYAHGLALALPAEVVVPALPTWGGPRRGSNMALARPTGVGRALTAYDMPIEGRDEWLASVERLA
jgi:hypothetical protein